MATKYRAQSEADLYHITARGVAKQIIFEEDDDRHFFGKRMRSFLEKDPVELYAWCFMSNHVHLLLHAPLEACRSFMKRLLTSYARYFNAKYGRTGHLFQDRFDSVPIQNEVQLMAAVRYIHRNPLEIPGESIESYPWSSYGEYLKSPSISKTEFVLDLFNSRKDFIAFHKSWYSEDDALDDALIRKPVRQLSDEEAVAFARNVLGVESLTSIASLDKPARNASIAALRESGLTIDQIVRITGIGRNIVQRARAE